MEISPLVTAITPLPHQWQTVEFLLSHKRCYNLSSCGSGKTLGSIIAMKALYESGTEPRQLVVAPLSVIVSTWKDHLEQFAPSIPVMFLDNSGNRKKRAMELVNFKGIVIINPDGVQGLWHELCTWRPGLLVIDELAGYYRNIKTNRWKALAALIYKCQPGVWGFTGTPVTKNLMDSYAQCLLVNPKGFPQTRTGRTMTYVQYRDRLMTNPAPYVWVAKKDSLNLVYDVMQPAIRFGREVMGGIKTPIRIRKDIPLTPEQKALYAALLKDGLAKYGTAQIKAKEAMTLITKATQIALGEVYDSAGKTVSIPSKPRLDALLDMFEEVEESPLIVAVPFVHTILALAEHLRLLDYRVAVVYGETPKPQRGEIIKAFQAGEYDFLICHPKTLAHGVTLTRSHTVVWYGPLYDLELYWQLCDRIFRYGQTEQPLIVEFSSTPIENRIYAALHGKEKLGGTYLELFGGTTK